MTTVEILRAARERYAANPSHAAFGAKLDGVCAVVSFGYSGCDRRTRGVTALARAIGIHVEDRGHFEEAGTNAAMIRWNAEHTTAEVLAAFDRAIAVEEAKAAEFTAEVAEPALV